MTDWMDDPETRRWARHVMADVVPKLRDSGATISVVPHGEPDIKFAVELGLSIMFDKPIILVVPAGRQLPDHLVRVADEIVDADIGSKAGQEQLRGAIRRVVP